MSTPDISVIIPAGRSGRWLDEAVMSTLDSEDADFELVVVLNGPAASETFVWECGDHVRVLRFDEPLGPTGAMIKGLNAARGRIIARLDSDDQMTSSRLQIQRDYLDANPDCSLVGGRVGRIDPDGLDLGQIKMPTGEDIRQHLLLWNPVVHSASAFRRTDLERAGGYDMRLRQMEDYDLFLRLGTIGKVAILDTVLSMYRMHPGQVSRSAGPRGFHIRKVMDSRRQLAKHLRVSPLITLGRNTLWRAVQFARASGLIRPGHEY